MFIYFIVCLKILKKS